LTIEKPCPVAGSKFPKFQQKDLFNLFSPSQKSTLYFFFEVSKQKLRFIFWGDVTNTLSGYHKQPIKKPRRNYVVTHQKSSSDEGNTKKKFWFAISPTKQGDGVSS